MKMHTKRNRTKLITAKLIFSWKHSTKALCTRGLLTPSRKTWEQLCSSSLKFMIFILLCLHGISDRKWLGVCIHWSPTLGTSIPVIIYYGFKHQSYMLNSKMDGHSKGVVQCTLKQTSPAEGMNSSEDVNLFQRTRDEAQRTMLR